MQQVYNSDGLLTQTKDITGTAKNVWSLNTTRDERGNFVAQSLGNGVITRKTFDPINGTLTAITSGKATSLSALQGTLQKLTYKWDSIGNLQYRKSQRVNNGGTRVEDVSETFEYDNLNRLDYATSYGLGITPRTRDYAYDIYGNLTYNGTSSLVTTAPMAPVFTVLPVPITKTTSTMPTAT
ncbi:MAG: hypothetical protein U5M23_01020 [Marinagarivorans sp.]|nr:hypothetical protein [Marinagarivorans sp.]